MKSNSYLFNCCSSNIKYCVSLKIYYRKSNNVLKLLTAIIKINNELLDIYIFYSNTRFINNIISDFFLDNDLIDFYKTTKSPSIKFADFEVLKEYLIYLYTASDRTLKKLHSIIEYNT